MNIEKHTIAGLEVEVHHKSIKNLHIGVYPPEGKIRVAAPLSLSHDAVVLAVLNKINWIKRKRADFQAQERQSARQYVSGETHYIWGRPRRLDLRTWDKRSFSIKLEGSDRLAFYSPAGLSIDQRRTRMLEWRRIQLRQAAAPKIAHWSKALGVSPSMWGIRMMRTMWGSCNPIKQIIWLNSDLIEKHERALEYVILHEMAHLISSRHDSVFQSVLDHEMPNWKALRAELNSLPLSAWPSQVGHNV